MKVKTKKISSMLLSLIMAVGLMIIPMNSKVSAADTIGKLKVHYIDVGQGDSILVQYNDYEILIDAGDNNMGDRVVNYIKPLVKGNLDLVIATHPDSDHIGGMDVVLKNFKVNKIIDSGWPSTSATYNDYMTEVKNQVKNGATYSPKKDMTINIASGVKLDIFDQGKFTTNNNNSVVSKLTCGNVGFMLQGDAEQEVEKVLLGKKVNLKADILKAGHHGSRTASSPEFVKAVNPQAAIISCGLNNKFGHPHSETLATYSSLKLPVYRTDKLSNIVVDTDGVNININGKYFGKGRTGSSSLPLPTNPTTDPTTNPTADPTTPAETTGKGLYIQNIDAKNEVVTIVNDSDEDLDLTGCSLVSKVGNQVYYFPNGFIIGAGNTVKIVSGRGASGDGVSTLKWSSSYIWTDSYDPGELYDANNGLISSFGEEK